MTASTVIIHGWSDCSASFRSLRDYMITHGVSNIDTIFYGDYESREDNVTFDDVVDGLNDEFLRLGFIDADGRRLNDLNVIVHSTGGLVIRHWIARYYLSAGRSISECPVRKIVMLATANFGSPLAHRGKSFLGQVFKGRWKIGDLFEVGRVLLDGLELGSPYQWNLAHRDLLGPTPPFTADNIQLTVLVGSQDYTGLRGWVNKPGTDGTVVIAGTSVDTVKFVLDCCSPQREGAEYAPYVWHRTDHSGDFAFAVLPVLDHGSIVDVVGKSDDDVVGPIVVEALKIPDAPRFRDFQDRLEKQTAVSYGSSEGPKAFQQFLVHVVDDQGNPVRDFTLEFFIRKASRAKAGVVTTTKRLAAEDALSRRANELLMCEFHQHSADSSYRRFLLHPASVRELVAEAKEQLQDEVCLCLRVYVPRIDRNIEYDTERLQNIVILDTSAGAQDAPDFLYENTTSLLELKVNRRCRYVVLGRAPRKH